MSNRWLGVLLILGTLFVMVSGFRVTEGLGDTFTMLAYLLWGIGGVAGIIGLIRTNALGANVTARALGFIPLLGFATFVVSESMRLANLMTADDSLFLVLATIGWISMLVGMLVVGIITIAAKAWRGWRRYVPLATILLALVGMALGQVVGTDIGGAISSAGFLLLGYVIATAEPAAFVPRSATA
jgi:hypothetical protein